MKNIKKTVKSLSDDRFYTIWFVLIMLLGSAFGAWLGTIITINTKAEISGSDAIAIANTYIVWASIIFILVTLALTILGFWATKKFSEDRTKEIHQNIIIIGNELRSNEATRRLFIEEIMKNEDIINELKEKIDEIKNMAIEEMREEARKHIEGGRDIIEGVTND